MTDETFTFRVDHSLKTAFASAAKSRDRTGAQVLRDFMRTFVQEQSDAPGYDAWFRRQVQLGIKRANAGHTFSASQVEADAAAWRSATRKQAQAAKPPKRRRA